MAELKIGKPAPRFSLKDKDGRPHSLGSSKADYTVLYFYPKDDTPGCTLEAKEFTASLKDFKSRNVEVVGISGGSDKTKASFCKKYSLKVPLVSDTNYKVAKSYGAYGKKNFMGRSYQGIFRKTFLVDRNGKIARIFDSVKPEGHAEEVLAAIDALKKGAKAVPAKAAKKVAAKKPTAKKIAAKKPASKRSVAKKAAPAKRKPAKKATAKRAVAPKKAAAKKK
jgi:peroxiredoxin Q/BCP